MRPDVETQVRSEEDVAQRLLRDELGSLEKRSEEQTCWLLAVTIAATLVLAGLVLPDYNRNHNLVIRVVGSFLVLWFVVYAMLIRIGQYQSWLKYVNVTVQVSMVTAIILIDASMRGPLYALSSMPPLFYALVVGLTSLALSPRLCLIAGVLAAAELMAAFAFYLRPRAVELDLATDPIASWEITAMKAIVLLAVGVAASFMARKARSLLTRVVSQVRVEEKLRTMEREIDLAAEIQAKLIPAEVPELAGLEIDSFYQPSKRVGGDYFDIIPRRDGRLVVVVADVSGKGYPAALMMSNVQAMVQILARQLVEPRSIVASLNNAVCKASTHGRFITLVYLEVDPDRRTITYVNCGHNPPIVARPDGTLDALEAGGPPLGVLADFSYDVRETAFSPGTLLVAYTDGLTEARRDGDEFGEARLRRIVEESREGPLFGVKERILGEVMSFLQDSLPGDDLTFVSLRSGVTVMKGSEVR